jgi:N-methylhydantoinase A
VDVRFVGQGSETNISVPEGDFSRIDPKEIRKRFDTVYEKLYGRTYPDSAVEFINFKVRASLPERLLKLPELKESGYTLSDAVKGSGLPIRVLPEPLFPTRSMTDTS